MMYWVLLAALSASVFLLVHSLAVLIVSAVLRLARGSVQQMQAGHAVNLLLALRVAPWGAALLVVSGIVAPAFLRNEPSIGEQHLSPQLIALTAMACALVVHSAVRSLSLLLRTRRLTRTWERSAERLPANDVPMPVFRFELEPPVMVVAGLLRPRLFISSGALALLDTEELQAALSHEAAHCRSGDLWKQLAMRALPDLLPGTRLLGSMERIFQRRLEEAADEEGTRDHSKTVPLASALVKFARCQTGLVQPTILGTHLMESMETQALATRVQLLLQERPQPRSRKGSPWAVWAILCAALPIVALGDYHFVLKGAYEVLETLAR
jgi:hypothetical protein